jgi:hypothetical protein
MAIDYGRLDVMGDSKFGDEFKEEARTREMSDREWLKDASERILGRQLSDKNDDGSAGADWRGQLASGSSRDDIMDQMIKSDEYQARDAAVKGYKDKNEGAAPEEKWLDARVGAQGWKDREGGETYSAENLMKPPEKSEGEKAIDYSNKVAESLGYDNSQGTFVDQYTKNAEEHGRAPDSGTPFKSTEDRHNWIKNQNETRRNIQKGEHEGMVGPVGPSSNQGGEKPKIGADVQVGGAAGPDPRAVRPGKREWGESRPGEAYRQVEGPGNPSWESRNPRPKGGKYDTSRQPAFTEKRDRGTAPQSSYDFNERRAQRKKDRQAQEYQFQATAKGADRAEQARGGSPGQSFVKKYAAGPGRSFGSNYQR